MVDNGIISLLGKWFDRIEDICAAIASVVLGVLTLTICVSVVSRYFFGEPMGWVQEVTEYALLFVTFLAAPWLLRQDGHVRVDIVLMQLNRRNRALLKAWGFALSAVACLFLLWFSAQATYDNYQRNVLLMKILYVPKFYLLSVIPLGSLLLAVEFARHVFRSIDDYRKASLKADKAAEEAALSPYSL